MWAIENLHNDLSFTEQIKLFRILLSCYSVINSIVVTGVDTMQVADASTCLSIRRFGIFGCKHPFNTQNLLPSVTNFKPALRFTSVSFQLSHLANYSISIRFSIFMCYFVGPTSRLLRNYCKNCNVGPDIVVRV